MWETAESKAAVLNDTINASHEKKRHSEMGGVSFHVLRTILSNPADYAKYKVSKSAIELIVSYVNN